MHRIGRTGRAGASGIAITLVDATDVHRWKMINKALDLPFDEPVETYSTSEHLFHDQGIAPGTKGRIAPPAPPAPRGERSGERGASRSGERRSGGERNRTRTRTRTRGGKPVEGTARGTPPPRPRTARVRRPRAPSVPPAATGAGAVVPVAGRAPRRRSRPDQETTERSPGLSRAPLRLRLWSRS
ncbi:hypothetical protein [Nocardioides humi]|uniref:hypothetical protein n=1 Tax=Nocardioides humi TaxID=449461 RepID=UPI003CCC6A80